MNVDQMAELAQAHEIKIVSIYLGVSLVLFLLLLFRSRVLQVGSVKNNLILGMASSFIFFLMMAYSWAGDVYHFGGEGGPWLLIPFFMILTIITLYYIGSTIYNRKQLRLENFIILLVMLAAEISFYYYISR